jgi:hypothetical protein
MYAQQMILVRWYPFFILKTEDLKTDCSKGSRE